MNPNEPQPNPPESTPPQSYGPPSPEAPQFNPPNPPIPQQQPLSAKGAASKAVAIVVSIIVALIVSLIIGAAVRGGLNDSDSAPEKPSSQATSPDEETSKPIEALAATSTYDYQGICDSSVTISNAAPHQKPYKVVPFYRTALEKWGPAFFSRDSGLMIEDDQVATVNTVACLEIIESTLKKATTCTYKDVDVALYTGEYTVTYRDPTTGKEIAKGSATVTGSDIECPSFVGYKKDDPRFFAIPDKTSLDAVVGAFVNS